MRTIEVIITPEGETKITTRGFAGKTACKAATKGMEDALGIVSSDTLTPEAFATPEKERVAQR